MSSNNVKQQDKTNKRFKEEFGLAAHSINTLAEFQYSLSTLSEKQKSILDGLNQFWDILDAVYMAIIGIVASFINSLFLPSFITGNVLYSVPIIIVSFATILMAHMTHFPALLSLFSKNPKLLFYSFTEMAIISWKKAVLKIIGIIAILLILKTINTFIISMYIDASFTSNLLKSKIENYFVNGQFYKSMFVNFGILFTAIVIP